MNNILSAGLLRKRTWVLMCVCIRLCSFWSTLDWNSIWQWASDDDIAFSRMRDSESNETPNRFDQPQLHHHHHRVGINRLPWRSWRQDAGMIWNSLALRLASIQAKQLETGKRVWSLQKGVCLHKMRATWTRCVKWTGSEYQVPQCVVAVDSTIRLWSSCEAAEKNYRDCAACSLWTLYWKPVDTIRMELTWQTKSERTKLRVKRTMFSLNLKGTLTCITCIQSNHWGAK